MTSVRYLQPRGYRAPPSPIQGASDSSLAILLAAGAMGFGLLSFLFPNFIEGRWGFMFGILMGLCLDGALWFGIIKNDHRCFALKLAFVAGWIGRFFPLGMCLTLPLEHDYLFPWGSYLFEDPLVANLGRSIRSVSIALVFLATRPFFPPKAYDKPMRTMLNRTSDRFELFLIFAGCIKLMYWLSITGLSNPIFYFVRILGSTIEMIPFFVGFAAFRFRKATLFWLGIFAFELVVSFLTGTRGAAFTPIMYFLIGFFLGLPDFKQRLRWSIVFAPVCIALVVAGVFIGAVRDVVGRTDLKSALTEGTLVSNLSDVTVTSNIDYTGGTAYKAFRRLSGWTSFVIPVMTPDPIPYRGFGDFGYELKSITTIGIFALINPQWRGNYYFGNIHLNQYGFAVHVDARGMKTSNVALPIEVDAFMRGGWFTAIGFLCFASLVIFIVERVFRAKSLPQKQPFFLVMLTIFCYIAAKRFGSASLVDSMRQLILEGTFCTCLYLGANFLLNKLGNKEKDPTSFRLK